MKTQLEAIQIERTSPLLPWCEEMIYVMSNQSQGPVKLDFHPDAFSIHLVKINGFTINVVGMVIFNCPDKLMPKTDVIAFGKEEAIRQITPQTKSLLNNLVSNYILAEIYRVCSCIDNKIDNKETDDDFSISTLTMKIYSQRCITKGYL